MHDLAKKSKASNKVKAVSQKHLHLARPAAEIMQLSISNAVEHVAAQARANNPYLCRCSAARVDASVICRVHVLTGLLPEGHH